MNKKLPDPTPTKYRFFILFIGCCAHFMNALNWACFLPILDSVVLAYPQATASNILAISNAFFIMDLPIAPIAIWVQQKYGLKYTLLIGIGLQAIGCMIRLFVEWHYSSLLIGSIAIACGQTFIVNIASILSANWFPQSERIISTMVMMNAYILGQAIGFMVPQAFISANVKNNTESEKVLMKSQIQFMLAFLTGICVTLQLAIYFLFKDKPESQNEIQYIEDVDDIIDQGDQETLISTGEINQIQFIKEQEQGQVIEEVAIRDSPAWDQFKLIIQNKNYLCMIFAASLTMSKSWTFQTVIELIILPYGYASKDASLFGFWNNIIGAVGCVVCSLLLARKKLFKKLTIVIIIGSILTFGLFFVVVITKSYQAGNKLAFMSVIFNGFFNLGIQGYCLEYAVDIAPEFSEAMSGGLFMALANTISFMEISYIQMIAKDIHHPKRAMTNIVGLTIGSLMVAGIMMTQVQKK